MRILIVEDEAKLADYAGVKKFRYGETDEEDQVGIVTGLAGTGDSPANRTTRQSLANVLSQFNLTVPPESVQSRNVAVVMITRLGSEAPTARLLALGFVQTTVLPL